MSFMDVMYGPLGSVNQGFQNNLGMNAANMANSNALVNSWQNIPQVPQAQLYGGGGFGAQPAYYAGLGAAYGRATGGFGGYGAANADPFTPVSPEAAASLAAFNYRGGGIGSDAYRGGQGGNYGAPAAAADPYAFLRGAPSAGLVGPYSSAFGFNPDSMRMAPSLYGSSLSSPSVSSYAGRYNMPDANPSYFNPGTYAGSQGNYGIPYNGQPQAGDIGFSRQSPMPNLGYNPGMQNWFANPDMNANQFQNRFGMGFPNAGTPSQVMPDYGNTLTNEDRYLRPHSFGEYSGGGA